MSGIKLIVGLGNPGEQYENTRHNAGFWWVDQLRAQSQSSMKLQAKLFGQIGPLSPHADTWLLKPNTFMNASGRAVAAVAHYYKIKPAEVLIIHDELDLAVGQAKLKFGGGHGGHNGLRDIHAALNTPDYWRLRIGIGHPGDRHAVINFVLKAPLKDEQTQINAAIDRSIAIVPDLLKGDFETAMLTLHTKK